MLQLHERNMVKLTQKWRNSSLGQAYIGAFRRKTPAFLLQKQASAITEAFAAFKGSIYQALSLGRKQLRSFMLGGINTVCLLSD